MSKPFLKTNPSLFNLFHWGSSKPGYKVILLTWILGGLLIVFYLFLMGTAVYQRGGSNLVKIMSYNIWNYHSYWPTRKKGVADLIRNEYPDVVLLQEVRSSERNKQLEDLMNLLPQYKYSSFAVATPNADYESSEGMGILSRHPIIEESHYNFSIVQTDGDRNTRTCLTAVIDIEGVGKIKVYVTHLSYEKSTQCRQVAELLAFIEEDESEKDCKKNIPKIVAGDFNIYRDFEAPAQIFTEPFSHSSLCAPFMKAYFNNEEEGAPAKFRDVWKELHPHDEGLTFSLMPFKDAEHFVPSTGLESRPDRMFVKADSCVLKETKIKRNDESEGDYASRYASLIFYEQLQVYLLPFGGIWPHAMFAGPLLLSLFALFRLPKYYLLVVIFVSLYFYSSFQNAPTNPDDLHPSDHLALIATFKKK